MSFSIFLTGWLGNVAYVYGAIALSCKKPIVAQVCNLTGGIFYILVGALSGIASLWALSVFLVCTNAYGIWNWKRTFSNRPKPRQSGTILATLKYRGRVRPVPLRRKDTEMAGKTYKVWIPTEEKEEDAHVQKISLHTSSESDLIRDLAQDHVENTDMDFYEGTEVVYVRTAEGKLYRVLVEADACVEYTAYTPTLVEEE